MLRIEIGPLPDDTKVFLEDGTDITAKLSLQRIEVMVDAERLTVALVTMLIDRVTLKGIIPEMDFIGKDEVSLPENSGEAKKD